MMIEVPDEVASRLRELADQHGCSVGDLLESVVDWNRIKPMLAQGAKRLPDEQEINCDATELYNSLASLEPPPGSLAALAQSALKANLGPGKYTDTAERSREILNSEFADYIRRHQA